jgi:hypothetical protein
MTYDFLKKINEEQEKTFNREIEERIEKRKLSNELKRFYYLDNETIEILYSQCGNSLRLDQVKQKTASSKKASFGDQLILNAEINNISEN